MFLHVLVAQWGPETPNHKSHRALDIPEPTAGDPIFCACLQVSVAQFRPEKNHRLQLDAYALARRDAEETVAALGVLRLTSLKPAHII